VSPLLWLSAGIRDSGTAVLRITEVLAIPALPEVPDGLNLPDCGAATSLSVLG